MRGFFVPQDHIVLFLLGQLLPQGFRRILFCGLLFVSVEGVPNGVSTQRCPSWVILVHIFKGSCICVCLWSLLCQLGLCRWKVAVWIHHRVSHY